MRYLIFAGSCYYSAGGARDFICGYDNEEDAKERASSIIGKTGVLEESEEDLEWDEICSIEWSHVFDNKSCEIVAKFGNRPYGRSFENDMILFIS